MTLPSQQLPATHGRGRRPCATRAPHAAGHPGDAHKLARPGRTLVPTRHRTQHHDPTLPERDRQEAVRDQGAARCWAHECSGARGALAAGHARSPRACAHAVWGATRFVRDFNTICARSSVASRRARYPTTSALPVPARHLTLTGACVGWSHAAQALHAGRWAPHAARAWSGHGGRLTAGSG
jgi:hypothetical protein